MLHIFMEVGVLSILKLPASSFVIIYFICLRSEYYSFIFLSSSSQASLRLKFHDYNSFSVSCIDN